MVVEPKLSEVPGKTMRRFAVREDRKPRATPQEYLLRLGGKLVAVMPGWGGLRAVGGASPVASAAADLASERVEELELSPAPCLGHWFQDQEERIPSLQLSFFF